MLNTSPSLNRLLTAAALALTALAATGGNATAATNVGVSVSVNQPGFYGRFDIGDQAPVLVYPQPIIVQQSPYGAQQRPIYMYVPPGHAQQWARYCGRYSACGQPVFFLRERPGRGHDHGRYERDDHRNDHRHDHRSERRDERHDWRNDDRRGDDRGRGHGRGHDRD